MAPDPRVQVQEIERVLAAVADLDTFAEGPNDDKFCPFGCGWEEYANEQHDEDCPISIARRLIERTS